MRDASVSVDLLAVEKIILSIEKGSISAVEDAQKDSRLLNRSYMEFCLCSFMVLESRENPRLDL